MKGFQYYKMLPESLEQRVIESELEEIMDSTAIDFTDALDCIYELSDRQVINYLPINQTLKTKIVVLFIKNWFSSSLKEKSLCMEIMLNFGLQEFYDFLKVEIFSSRDSEIIKEFSEITEEFGGDINNVSFRD